MVQAHARELLNQKESKNDTNLAPAYDRPLFAATQRLVAALNRLEKGLQQVESGQQELVLVARENESLKAERDDLSGTISNLQQQYTDLHKVAGTIYNKLDDSIKRLTKIMDS